MPRFHFSLLHLDDQHKLEVSLQEHTFPLTAHTEESHQLARTAHPVLSQVAEEKLREYSHFADIDDIHLEGDAPRWLQVVLPAEPGSLLQEVVLMSQIIPPSRLRAFYQSPMWRERHLRRYGRHATHTLREVTPVAIHHTGRMHALGIMPNVAAGDKHIETLVAAQELVDTLTTAAGLVAHHPSMATTQPYTATYVRDNNILPDPAINPDQYNAMTALKGQLDKTPRWSPIIDCNDHQGNPIKAEYDLGKIKTGQQMQTFSVVGNVLSATAPATGGAQKSVNDDLQLQNQLWSPTPGTSAIQSSDTATNALTAKLNVSSPQYKWTVPYQTYTNGIKLPKESLKIDDKNNFSIECYNLYARTLYLAYELFDGNGKSMGPRTALGSISAVDNIMGIPIPVFPTTEAFNISTAHKIKIYIGSLGASNWDDVTWAEINVSDRGALLTGAYQYGIPIAFMIAGKLITDSTLFNKIVSDKELTGAAIAILGFLVGAAAATESALGNWKQVMLKYANIALSFVVKKGMEKLGEWVLEQLAEAQMTKALGPVGWLFQLVAVGLAVEQMAITTGEVLASDSLTTAEIKRAIDVKMILLPDPKHGEEGNPKTAVWPSVATHFVATLQCQNGTNFVVKGEMPSTTSGEHIPINFIDVPGNSNIRIFVGLYSANGWLAGTWQSDWMSAVANEGTTLDLGEKAITENLVPLGIDTQYVFKEKIQYADKVFSWINSDAPPSTTLASLNCKNDGGLCDLTAITVNNSAFQVGYVWRAAKQNLHPDSPTAPVSEEQLYNVQNLSVLAKPSDRLKTTTIGFTQKPGIAYAPSTNTKEIDQNNFILDPRNGKMNLRKVRLGENTGSDFGLGDINLLSWGSFPLDNIDTMAIHPSNAVLACSFSHSKLMILQLPEEGSSDDKAPEARMVSGEGIREGLMKGPKALSVAPDGRILVLESLNNRVQAFDTLGNAVPCFTPNSWIFTLPTPDVAATLDAGKVPDSFVDGLVQAKENIIAPLDGDFIAELDGGKFQPEKDPLITALSQLNINLSYDPENMGDPNKSAQIQVVQAGQSWMITDPRQQAWQIINESGLLMVYKRSVTTDVEVQKPGARWLLKDNLLGLAWMLEVSSGDPKLVEIFDCFTYFPLKTGPNDGNLNYLDMAVEAQGYMYILSYQNDGSAKTDYLLDVYAPDGTFLFRSPDASKTTTPQNIVAGRITVDVWRDLYAMTYETLIGPDKVMQPGLAHWMPTPPLFSFPLTEQPNFNAKNISAIQADFAAHNIVLNKDAFILVENPDGYWQVKDDKTIYHVYRSGEALQVYSVPA